MKTRFWKPVVCILLICMLAFSLTGCEELDYRDAVDLYNAGAYEAAAQKFAALGDFEDSAQLETRCYYWIAMKAMEYGRFDAALEQFLALGDYEDCPERVTECRYQLAVAAFDGGDLEAAERYFLQSPDYKQTREYCRQITWQKFFDAIAGKAPGEAESILSAEKDGHTIQVIARSAEVQEIVFSISAVKDMGYVFTDTLMLRFRRDSLQAAFAAESSFTMDFKGGQIGSHQTGSGTLDIPTFNGETPLVLESFGMTVTDNLGKSTSSTDPADCLMGEDIAENLALLMAAVPGILSEAGIPFTLADIGFAAMA